MDYNLYRKKNLQQNFGTILIILGIIPLTIGFVRFIVVFIGFAITNGLILNIIESLTLVILWIILLVNNSQLKKQLNSSIFNAYYSMLLMFCLIRITGEVSFWVAYVFIWDPLFWLISLLVYDGIIAVGFFIAVFMWIRLGKYGQTLPFIYGPTINIGTKLLITGAILQIGSMLLDIFGALLLTDEDTMLIFIFIIGLIGLVGLIFDIIGYIKVGNTMKRVPNFSVTGEPTIDGFHPVYSAPQPGTSYPPSLGPREDSNQIRFCIKCGALLIPDGSFCPNCGWKLEQF